jgi:hypothetical protein
MTTYDTFQAQVDAYRKGSWTRNFPTLPGIYHVRALGSDCAAMGHNEIVVYKRPDGVLQSVDSWGGWWWSVPIPELPPTPDAPDALEAE